MILCQASGLLSFDVGIRAGRIEDTVSLGYDARADFHRNGIVNISDFGFLAGNFMQMSPVEVK